MIRFHQNSSGRSTSRSFGRLRLLLGVLCVALVLIGSTLQVAHAHPAGGLSHADCSLCATAHVVADIAVTPTVLATVFAVASAPAVESQPRQVPAGAFALFTRPPPAVLSLA